MKIKISLCLLMMILALPVLCYSDGPVGVLTSIEGRVDVLKPGGGGGLPVVTGEHIYVGDTLRTKSFSMAHVEFIDGSILRLAPNTKVFVDRYDCENGVRKDASLKLWRGKMRTIVKKVRGKTNFFVSTPNTSGEIRGSDIMVMYQGSSTTAVAKDGGIDIFNPEYPDTTVNLRKGEVTTVPADGPPAKKRDLIDFEMKLHLRDTDPREEAILEEADLSKMEGWIASASGTVKVRKAGEDRWRDATPNQKIEDGDEVETEEESNAQIRLDNGNYVMLKPGTGLKVVKIERDPKTGTYKNVFEAKTGKLKAVVEKLGKGSSFEVRTPVATCGVRGTVMYLNIKSDWTQAFYEGGGGYMKNTISGEQIDIGSGHNAFANMSGRISNPIFTTTQQRMDLDEAWGVDDGTLGYSGTEGGNQGTGGQQFGAQGGSVQNNRRNFVNWVRTIETKVPVNETQPTPQEGFGMAGRFRSYNPEKGEFGEFESSGQLTAAFRVADIGQPVGEFDVVGLQVLGTSNNPNDSKLFTGQVKGSPVNGVEMNGYSVGALGSWEAIVTSMYVGGDGEAGGIFGLLGGEMGAGGALAGGGDVFKFPMSDEVLHNPSDIYNDELFDKTLVSGTLSGEYDEGFFEHQSRKFTTDDEGIWRGAYYQQGVEYDNLPDLAAWYVAELHGIDDNGDSMELYLLSGDMDEGSCLAYVVGSRYRDMGDGYFESIETFFGAGLGEDRYSGSYEGTLDIELGAAGIFNTFDKELYGVQVFNYNIVDWSESESAWMDMGRSLSISMLASKFDQFKRWHGFSANISLIGDILFSVAAEEAASFLWYQNDGDGNAFKSYDIFRDTMTTRDGAAFYGVAGGAADDGYLFGGARALYVAPAEGGDGYDAGIMYVRDIEGLYSHESQMLAYQGLVTTMPLVYGIDMNPEDLYPGGSVIQNSWDSGNFTTVLPGGGLLSGSMGDHLDFSISGEPWGVWDNAYQLQYTPNGESRWFAMGTGDYLKDGVEGAIRYVTFGEVLGERSMGFDIVGISLEDDTRAFYKGNVAGIYDSYFNGSGVGTYFNEKFFGDFTTPYSADVVEADSRILMFAQSPPDPIDGTYTQEWYGGFLNDGEFVQNSYIGVNFAYGCEIAFAPSEDYLRHGLTVLDLGGVYVPMESYGEWYLPIGGYGFREAIPTPGSEYAWDPVQQDLVWLANINGTEWKNGTLRGTFKGFWYAKHDDGEFMTTSAGLLGGNGNEGDLVGGIIGNYVDGDDYDEWDATIVAEWVEVTSRFGESMFGIIEDFITNAPIVAIYSYSLLSGSGAFQLAGGGALTNVAMDINFLSNATGNIWTSIINGEYSGLTGDIWRLSWTGDSGYINFYGDLWDDLTKEWHANVSGVWDTHFISPGSEAAGTFDGGIFTGIGTGRWTWAEAGFGMAGHFRSYNSAIGAFESSGQLSASISVVDTGENGQDAEVIALQVEGGYINPAGAKLFTADVSGSPVEGVEVKGYSVGSLGSWEAIIASMYVANDGETGAVFGMVDGIGPGLTGGGDVFRFPLSDNVLHIPTDLFNEDLLETRYFTGGLAGEYNTGFFEHQTQKFNGVEDEEGIWRGFYHQEALEYDDLPDMENWYITELQGTDETDESSIELYLLSGDMGEGSSLVYGVGSRYTMDQETQEMQEPLETFFGMGLGTVQANQEYEGTIDLDLGAAGVFNTYDKELYGVQVFYNDLSDWNEAEGAWEKVGRAISISSLASNFTPFQRWHGFTAYLTNIGDLLFGEAEEQPDSFLWYPSDDDGHWFSSYDIFHDAWDTHYGGAFYGTAGGAAEGGYFFGGARALYLAPSEDGEGYDAGIMYVREIDGLYSTTSNSYAYQGLVTTMPLLYGTEMTPEDLFDGETVIEDYRDSGSFDNPFPGAVEGAGLSGPIDDHLYLYFDGEDWGVWDSEYHLEYVPNGESQWFAKGTGDLSNGDMDEDLYFMTHGELYGESSMEFDILGISLGEGSRRFYTGKVVGIYDDFFHGIGVGTFFNDDFFGDFITPYSEIVADSRVLMFAQSPPGPDGFFTPDWSGGFIDDGAFVNNSFVNVHWAFGYEIGFEPTTEYLRHGLSVLSMDGAYHRPDDSYSDWFLPIGGYGFPELSPDHEQGWGVTWNGEKDLVWIGNVNGTEWKNGTLRGNFQGFWFSRDLDGEDTNTTAGILGGRGEDGDLVGGVIGNYVDGEDYEWDATVVAEWVEVTALFDDSIFDTINDFVTTGNITAIYTDALLSGSGAFNIAGGGALTNVAMDISFLSNATGNIWTSIINGEYSGLTSDSWNVNWTNGADQINLIGDLWDNTTNDWHATVNGMWDAHVISPGSEAGGTFDPAAQTFTGVGVGEWTEQQAGVIDGGN
ncbi:MAG: FecR family protein [Candidatus Omnitrophota bacterium]